jgi:hypothetical protein
METSKAPKHKTMDSVLLILSWLRVKPLMQDSVQWVDGCRRCDSSKKNSMALFGYKYGVVGKARVLVCSWWKCEMRVDR